MIYYKSRFLILYFIIGFRHPKSNHGCFLHAMKTLNRFDTLFIIIPYWFIKISHMMWCTCLFVYGH